MGRDQVAVLLAGLLFGALAPGAGAQGRGAPPTNLQVLTPDVDLPRLMLQFNASLGVQCVHCHVAGDFASDANPKKATARGMLRMLQRVAARFPDSGNDFSNSRYRPFPEGKQYVTCFTCHQGAALPFLAAPDPKGPPRAPEPGAPPGAPGGPAGAGPGRGQGARGAGGGAAPGAASTAAPLRPGRGRQQYVNMVELPADTDTFMVMPAFRAALGVECNFCHVFGSAHERGHADERHLDGNPKKIVARNMVGMLKEINAALFPAQETDIVFAASSIVQEGQRYVTCYTCHRGHHVPPAEP